MEQSEWRDLRMKDKTLTNPQAPQVVRRVLRRSMTPMPSERLPCPYCAAPLRWQPSAGPSGTSFVCERCGEFSDYRAKGTAKEQMVSAEKQPQGDGSSN